MDDATLEALQAAIEGMLSCEAEWKKLVQVTIRTDDDQIAWNGDVALFHLIGHKKATICYAWPNATKGERPHIVLHGGPVAAAESAVRSVIVGDSR